MSGIRIGSNIESMRAQRRLSESSYALGRSSERLSSGQRINQASDDAAGLAIADTLKARSKLYSVAGRNISDGLSITNIVDSALSEQQRILQRLGELAEQSANGVYSFEQRRALEVEYRQLVSESDRIAQTTEFNGISLLSGTGGILTLQVGTGGESEAQLTHFELNTSSLSGTIVVTPDLSLEGGVDGSDLSVWIDLFNEPTRTLDRLQTWLAGSVIHQSLTDSSGQERDCYLAPWYFGWSSTQIDNDWTRFAVFADDGSGNLVSVGLSDYSRIDNAALSVDLTFSDASTATLSADLSGLTWHIADGPEYLSIIYDIGKEEFKDGIYAGKSCIAFTGVETQQRARDALATITNRQRELSEMQGQLGAFQTRLSTALACSSISAENCLSAESRIRAVDVAEEAGNLTRQQILQKIATAVLTQANQSPQIALTLLR